MNAQESYWIWCFILKCVYEKITQHQPSKERNESKSCYLSNTLF